MSKFPAEQYREALARRIYLDSRVNDTSWAGIGAIAREQFRRYADQEAADATYHRIDHYGQIEA